MVRFISLVDLVPFIMEKKACIQFLFVKGFLNTRMVFNEYYAFLNLKDYSNKIYPAFVCRRAHNKLTVSATKGTWFENHSLHFAGQITNVHTNNIQSRWRSLRNRQSRGGIRQNQMYSYISEYLWHLDSGNRGADPFQELIEYIKTVYPVQ